MQDAEHLIRSKLDGTFMQWNPNSGTFTGKLVSTDFLPDFRRCLDFASQKPAKGRVAKKRDPDEECRAHAETLLRGGLGARDTVTRLVVAHRIATASAEILVRAVRKEIYG